MAKIKNDIVIAEVYRLKMKELNVRDQMKIPRNGYAGDPPKKQMEIKDGRRGYFFAPMGEAILVTRKH